MLIRNVEASSPPDEIEVIRIGTTNYCHLYVNDNIRELCDLEGRTYYIFDQYSLLNQPYSQAMVLKLSKQAIMRKAVLSEIPEISLEDVVDALNLLTEIVLRGA